MNKKILFAAFLMLSAWLGVSAQSEVLFEFENHERIPEGTPVQAMERNAALLLTAINRAAEANAKSIDCNGIGITSDATKSLAMTWANVHFSIMDDDIIQKCVVLRANGRVRGYEASNIAVEMRPLQDTYKEALHQEITLSFDTQGNVSDFVVSMGRHQYTTFLRGARTLEDADRAAQIMHYVDQFRTAYIQKDIEFMKNVFSDDALIITGRVQKRVKAETGMQTVVEYTRQSKAEYLKNLAAAFKRNAYVNVVFEQLDDQSPIEYNPVNPNIFGVTLKQKWYSSTYSDEGIVFLLWDFSDEDAPKIYVRTWQPLEDTHRFMTTEFNI